MVADSGAESGGCDGLRLGQALQNLLTQFLRLAEKFLILDKDPVQLQRLIGREFVAQHHVAHVDRVGQCCIFRQFFKRDAGVVVVHALYCSAA
jgi:hypothetical protein